MGWLSWCIKDLWGTKVMYCYVVKWPVFSLQRGPAKWPIAPSNFSSLWPICHKTLVVVICIAKKEICIHRWIKSENLSKFDSKQQKPPKIHDFLLMKARGFKVLFSCHLFIIVKSPFPVTSSFSTLIFRSPIPQTSLFSKVLSNFDHLFESPLHILDHVTYVSIM